MNLKFQHPLDALRGTKKAPGSMSHTNHRGRTTLMRPPNRDRPHPPHRQWRDPFFSLASKGASSLSDSQREAWTTFGALLSRDTLLGTFPYTWRGAYILINRIRLFRGQALSSTPPNVAPAAFPLSVSSCTYTPGSHLWQITLSYTGITHSSSKWRIRLWRGSRSAQRRGRKSDLRMICGPTSDSFFDTDVSPQALHVFNPAFHWTDPVLQTVEVTFITALSWPGTPSRFHLQQSII